MRAPCASRRSTTSGIPPTRSRASIPRSKICRFTPERSRERDSGVRTQIHSLCPDACPCCLTCHFVQVATTVVPFTTDHLLSPAVRMRKQLGWEPFQVVQKPSFVSFQVPSPFEPPPPIGSRVIFPSALNIILYFMFVADAGEGLPFKKVAWSLFRGRAA